MKSVPLNKSLESGQRLCSICNEYKPSTFFYQKPKYWCKQCASEWHKEYHKKVREKRIEYFKEYTKSDRGKKAAETTKAKYPEKNMARKAVRNAVAQGKFVKEVCIDCTNEKTEFHHTNGYDKDNWFTGVWLCRGCHVRAHNVTRKAEREKQLNF